MPSPYGVTGVFAGETEAVHAQTLERCYEQYLVPVKGQADILVTGIPYISPYNVNSFLNPLLVQVMAHGYLFNLYRGAPMVKKGGHDDHPATPAPTSSTTSTTLRTSSSCTTCSPRRATRWSCTSASRRSSRRTRRTSRCTGPGHAYHPAHPFFMWYWGEAGRQHLGRVIVVGADNDYIPKLLGWETARTMHEALRDGRATARRARRRSRMLHMPPILMADVVP